MTPTAATILVAVFCTYFGIGIMTLVVFALYVSSQGGSVSWPDAARAVLAWPYYAWTLGRR